MNSTVADLNPAVYTEPEAEAGDDAGLPEQCLTYKARYKHSHDMQR